MPECGNCGSFVTEDYVRTMSRRDSETVEVCPWCPDQKRDARNRPREARSNRRADMEERGEPSEYDPRQDPTVEYATDGGATDGE